MGMDRCTDCGAVVNTDDYPESYREEFNWDCVCNACYQEPLEPEDIAAAKADIANDLEKCYGPRGY